ncbi:hypothetical protein [Rhodopseudomonas palustris]|uniref:Uncharacterized protein n=1 Tax=Rhodopseudomonas palustris (strain BisB18) TaxID=316056 RepID=Q210N4_RHOPB
MPADPIAADRARADIPAPDSALILAAARHCWIVHHVPGRIRLRFDLSALATLLHDRTATLETALRRVRGITGTEINLAACSLIVHYATKTLPPASWDRLLEGSPASAALLAQLLASD